MATLSRWQADPKLGRLTLSVNVSASQFNEADFETTLRAYNAQKSDADEVDAATSVRPRLEEALRKLLTFLPMQAEVTGNSSLNELVKQLEVEVSRF